MNGNEASSIEHWTRVFLDWTDDLKLSPSSSILEMLDRLESEIRSCRIAIGSDDGFPKGPDAFFLTAGVFQRAYENLIIQTASRASVRKRRETGVYFTPSSLVGVIGEHGVSAALAERTRVAGSSAADVQQGLESYRVCDPSCGVGDFLLDAGRRIVHSIAAAHAGNAEPIALVRRRVVQRSLFGMDIDAHHVRAARMALWLWAGAPDDSLEDAVPNIVCGDALAVNGDGALAICSQWTLTEFGNSVGFDAVVGNPPFANAIEDELRPAMKSLKQRRRELFAELSGTADAAYYFLVLADKLAKADGMVGFVVPRAFLSAPSAKKLRRRLLQSRPPAMIFAPPDQFLFSGANIFVAAIALRKGCRCQVSHQDWIANRKPEFRLVDIEGDNWWALVTKRPAGSDTSCSPSRKSLATGTARRLGDHFEVFASMTTGMAYELIPFVLEEDKFPEDASSIGKMRLVTTGLIDPGECHWGTRPCRYLRRRYERPIVDRHADMPRLLRARLDKVRRPKLLIAGLCVRMEAYLDEARNYCGAVSTWTVLHPRDEVAELRELCDYLNGDCVSIDLERQLGATALGGGRITVTKNFLRNLPLP